MKTKVLNPGMRFSIAFLTCALITPAATACTGIRLSAADGAVVHSRTLEFAVDLQSDVILVPRNFARVGTTPDGMPGKQWKSKYASLGANAVGLPIIVDGLNERGLAVGAFYFPNTASYQVYAAKDAAQTIAPWEVGSYLLDNCANVEEVRQAMSNVVVPPVVLSAWKFVPPVHYVVHDSSGASLAIEYAGGKLNLFENPLGVMSNSPTFDWHMTNLRNYINFSLTNALPVKLGRGNSSVTLLPFGQGSGMLGIPGDFTPPSRFVRAAAYSQSAIPSATGYEAVLQAFHILNNFDIPKGSIRESGTDEHGNQLSDYTCWTSANDLKAKRFYFRTYENSQIRMIDLTRQNLDGKDVRKWSMKGDEIVSDISAR